MCEVLSFVCCPQPYSKDHHSQNVPRNCFFLGGEGGDAYSIKGQTSKIFLSISEILWEESNIQSGGKSLRACLQRSWQGWRSNFLSGSGAPGISKSIFSRNFYLRREKSRPSNNLSACNPHIKSKHLKGQLGPCVSDAFLIKEVSWDPLLVTHF